MQKITQQNLINKIKTTVKKPTFGLKEAIKKGMSMICIFEKYLPLIDKKTLDLHQEKFRTFDIETLKKIKSVLNRTHTINVISF